jgi:2'-5' RNA ligase
VSSILRDRAIVLFLPVPEPDAVVALRRKFDPLFGTLAAHITLVFPFHSDMPADALRRHVEVAVRGVSPIKVRLSGVTGADAQYLFLNVKRGNDALIDLHDRLYQGSLHVHLSDEFSFLPHVTIGRLADKNSFRAALDTASATSIDFEVTLDTVTVYDAVTRTVETEVALVEIPGSR